jgi:UDP-N-acetylglucosamine 2-epimerase
MTAFEPLAAELVPDVVVVIGDVNSTLAVGPRVAAGRPQRGIGLATAGELCTGSRLLSR